jgi:hypothetical protein
MQEMFSSLFYIFYIVPHASPLLGALRRSVMIATAAYDWRAQDQPNKSDLVLV